MCNFNDHCFKSRVTLEGLNTPSNVRVYLQTHNVHQLKDIKKVWMTFFKQGNVLPINKKYQYILRFEPALQKLIKEGKIEQYRESVRYWSGQTYLRIKDESRES